MKKEVILNKGDNMPEFILSEKTCLSLGIIKASYKSDDLADIEKVTKQINLDLKKLAKKIKKNKVNKSFI